MTKIPHVLMGYGLQKEHPGQQIHIKNRKILLGAETNPFQKGMLES